MAAKFEISSPKAGQFNWVLKSQGRTLASGEGYTRRASCEKAIGSLRTAAASATIDDTTIKRVAKTAVKKAAKTAVKKTAKAAAGGVAAKAAAKTAKAGAKVAGGAAKKAVRTAKKPARKSTVRK
jgi:uncharacterized protein YegP (UPF0339 family)